VERFAGTPCGLESEPDNGNDCRHTAHCDAFGYLHSDRIQRSWLREPPRADFGRSTASTHSNRVSADFDRNLHRPGNHTGYSRHIGRSGRVVFDLACASRGIELQPIHRIISGTPTGTSAQASYVVTVTNTAGSIASAPVTITITAKPIVLMQVGFSSGPLAFANGSVLSGGGYSSSADDSFSPWTLWNYQTGAMLATGDAGLGGKSISAGGNFGQYDQMAGPTAAIQLPGGIEVLSSSDGHLLGIIAAPDYMYGYRQTRRHRIRQPPLA